MDPRRQRICTIKESLQDMTMDELQSMSDDLNDLIQVLVTRQVAIEDVILERLEEAFSK
jgi:Holliday junction resolvasome RuvABC endonuclease subunit